MISLPFSNEDVGTARVVLATLALFGRVRWQWGSARARGMTKSYSVSGRARVHVDSNDGSVA